jgi:hypothetical protein
LDAEDAGTNEAAERYLKCVAEANYQAPRRIAELVAGQRRVFFGAGDFDLQAVHRFSHRADTFIFVDARRTEAEHEDVRHRLVNQQTKAGDELVAIAKGQVGEGRAMASSSDVVGDDVRHVPALGPVPVNEHRHSVLLNAERLVASRFHCCSLFDRSANRLGSCQKSARNPAAA